MLMSHSKKFGCKNLWTNISDKEIYSNIYFLNGYNFTNVNNVNVYWINKTIN